MGRPASPGRAVGSLGQAGPGAATLLAPTRGPEGLRGPRHPVPGHAAARRLWLGTASVLVLF